MYIYIYINIYICGIWVFLEPMSSNLVNNASCHPASVHYFDTKSKKKNNGNFILKQRDI